MWSPANETLEKGWMRHWDRAAGCSYIPVNEIGIISATETLEKLGKDGTIDSKSIPERFKNLMPAKQAPDFGPPPKFPPVKPDFITGMLRQALFLDTFSMFFLDFAPHLDNVTNDRRYSRLLVDFSSVKGECYSNISFSGKRSF